VGQSMELRNRAHSIIAAQTAQIGNRQ
jgi:hypothetical protein